MFDFVRIVYYYNYYYINIEKQLKTFDIWLDVILQRLNLFENVSETFWTFDKKEYFLDPKYILEFVGIDRVIFMILMYIFQYKIKETKGICFIHLLQEQSN